MALVINVETNERLLLLWPWIPIIWKIDILRITCCLVSELDSWWLLRNRRWRLWLYKKCSHKCNLHLYGRRMGLPLRRKVHCAYSVGIVSCYQSREAWHSGWGGDEGTVLPNVRHFSWARYITCERDMMDVGVACSLSLHPESGDLSTMVKNKCSL